MLTGHQVLFAQPILAGDDCSTATVLTPGTQCSMVNYTHIGATNSTGVPNPTCGSYTGGCLVKDNSTFLRETGN
ncbi:MAG: hypothetical protein HWD58_08450 [Bacteroidota bacterium]|nr:MAG: hypothetical protein HWD58_08450 [Bacteroidota bacterium]